MSDQAEAPPRKPERLTQISCEHPYESTTSTPFNGGRDVEIQCGKCMTTVRVAVYRILIARDLAIWGRHQVRRSEPPGSQGVSPLRSLTREVPTETDPFSPPWPLDYPSPRLRVST